MSDAQRVPRSGGLFYYGDPETRLPASHPLHQVWVPVREVRRSYMGHIVMENRHGLAVADKVSQANGTAERRASEAMLKR